MINIVLYEPEIPANTGNIMRTCIGIGARLHLIKPLGFSLDEKSIKRSGAGYTDMCDYHVYENYDDFKSKNIGEYYFLTRYSTNTYSDNDYSKDKNIYLIFGKESTGIPKEILKENLKNTFRIPTTDKIRSLNLSNAVAIVAFEVLRQKDFLGLKRYDVFKGKDYIIK